MDEDLKKYLRGMEDRTASLIAGVEERTAALIAAELGVLHTDIQEVEQRLGARLDEMNVRLDTHAGLLQTGSRQMAKFLRFSESSSKYWRGLAKRIDALERRG
jgi:hypothetical protein